jgi:hypothetical protein
MRWMNRSNGWVGILGVLAVLGPPTDAAACGGCFNPLGSPAPVTAHRMAISISPTQTTLWDQIEYAGAPEDFVWVLPVMGSPTVELADNAFFDSLTNTTQIVMQGPTPPNAFCGGGGGGGFGCAADSASPSVFSDAGISRVTVLFEGVVGPYETVTLSSDDPMELIEWLQERDYAIDDAILPTIAYYTDRGANFVVLRLAPQEGIDRMQPVRITSPGLSLTFPLRMVAAGVELTVDLELFVFAEARMEAANFGNAEVDRDSIVYDWATSTFSYEAAFDDAVFIGEGVRSNWVTEYAQLAPVAQLTSWITFDDDGEAHEARPDMDVALASIPTPYLTRLRTRLPPSELDRDLILRMSESEDVGTFINVTREVNRAPDADCSSGGGCTVLEGRLANGAWIPALFALIPLALSIRRRR